MKGANNYSFSQKALNVSQSSCDWPQPDVVLMFLINSKDFNVIVGLFSPFVIDSFINVVIKLRDVYNRPPFQFISIPLACDWFKSKQLPTAAEVHWVGCNSHDSTGYVGHSQGPWGSVGDRAGHFGITVSKISEKKHETCTKWSE